MMFVTLPLAFGNPGGVLFGSLFFLLVVRRLELVHQPG